MIANVYTVLRLLASTYAYIVVVNSVVRGSFKLSKISLMLILFLALQVLSSVINGSITINTLIAFYTYVGFLLLCEQMQSESGENFLWAIKNLFGILCLLGGAMIVAYPNGFFNATTKASAFYLLGSKNASFFYYFIFLEAFVLYHLSSMKRYPKNTLIIIILMLITVFICDSGNSIICLTLIAVFYILGKYGNSIAKRINPMVLMTALAVVGVIIYAGANWPVIGTVVNAIGRDESFTGRDTLWADAIGQFLDSPLWGNGAQSVFALKSGRLASHAHSFALDTLAKYGVFTFLAYVGTVLSLLKRAVKCCNKNLAFAVVGFLFVANLHMLFDLPSNYFIVIIVMIGNAALKQDECYRLGRTEE